MDLVGAVIDWWRRRRPRPARFSRVLTYASRADVPAKVPRRAIAVVDGSPRWAIFECPCGSGHERIELLLTPRGGMPTWHLSGTGSGPTLHPSVDYVAARRCHFWVRSGRVHWT